jgi:hypothetical protein
MFFQTAEAPDLRQLHRAGLSRSDGRLARNEQVRRELEGFYLALNSYPARFAQDPNLTFEKHCRSVMANNTRPRGLDESR